MNVPLFGLICDVSNVSVASPWFTSIVFMFIPFCMKFTDPVLFVGKFTFSVYILFVTGFGFAVKLIDGVVFIVESVLVFLFFIWIVSVPLVYSKLSAILYVLSPA